ncbi:MAG TPA: RES family NAD+ phosphorylase [Solirubrobacterales bacterium]|jgi:RES domain-containing protein|nr:RES family NAD+ phosphorylase [Solirubrobacterales bacterium]
MPRDPQPNAIDVEATFFRYSSYDVPFWVRSNTTDERWHSAGEGSTQYLSATPDGAWAELIRNENLRSEADLAMVAMPLWQVQIDQGHVADYRNFETADEAGFDPEALVSDDQRRCRAEGKRLREAGFAGVLYPSAALPGELNLALFGPRILLPWSAPRRLASGIPGMKLTVGAPPVDLLSRVRHAGAHHAGFSEYQRLRRRRSGKRP